jgi:hypothetical protein
VPLSLRGVPVALLSAEQKSGPPNSNEDDEASMKRILLGLPQLRSPPAAVLGTGTGTAAVAGAVFVVGKSSLTIRSDATVAIVGSMLFLRKMKR